MKGKFFPIFTVAVLLFVLSTGQVFAVSTGNDVPPQDNPEESRQINLTDSQKNELKQLYNKKFDIQKQIIQKYAEYGVITKSAAEAKLKKMDERLKKIERDGYIPKHHGGKRDGHKKTDLSSIEEKAS